MDNKEDKNTFEGLKSYALRDKMEQVKRETSAGSNEEPKTYGIREKMEKIKLEYPENIEDEYVDDAEKLLKEDVEPNDSGVTIKFDNDGNLISVQGNAKTMELIQPYIDAIFNHDDPTA